jgi:catechol 2,3-dioxygenase-like lactoylglutathione lyase family enzyme
MTRCWPLSGLRDWKCGHTTIGYGKRYPEFWLNARPGDPAASADSGTHICLRAPSTEAIDAFHAAALRFGGACDGAPGLRPQHGEGYYAAFIRDLDGNRIEAVTFLAADS